MVLIRFCFRTNLANDILNIKSSCVKRSPPVWFCLSRTNSDCMNCDMSELRIPPTPSQVELTLDISSEIWKLELRILANAARMALRSVSARSDAGG